MINFVNLEEIIVSTEIGSYQIDSIDISSSYQKGFFLVAEHKISSSRILCKKNVFSC